MEEIGGTSLISVTFESRREAVSLYTCINEKLRDDLEMRLSDELLVIGTENERMTPTYRATLTHILSDFIVNMFEEKWLLEIIEKEFYFKEQHDQEAILDIIHAIFDGEKNDLPKVDALPSSRDIIEEAISDLVDDQSVFSFQSIKMFRLVKYRACLGRYVELAIDEYKLQQEYLAFIDKLRRIIKTYRPLHDTIHAIDEQPFKLYDEAHKPINNVQSIRSFYPFLKQWGIEAEPSILLTLIGLAPKTVMIYTDRPEHGMMKTLRNVFEERVRFIPNNMTTVSNRSHPI